MAQKAPTARNQADIRPGTAVRIRDAYGKSLALIAASAIEPGNRFPIVWACTPAEWERAEGSAVCRLGCFPGLPRMSS